MARQRRSSFGCIISTGTTTHPAFIIRWYEGSRRKQKGGFRTKTDAADALARIRTGLGDGTLVERRRASIGFDEVAKQWLELHSKPTLRSHALNEMNYRIHVEPFFGDCPLSAVDPAKILELRVKLQATEARLRGDDAPPRRLSARTINLVIALVRSILRFAVANGHIATSPTARLGRGKLMLPVAPAKLEPPIGKPESVGALLERIREIRPDRYALFATLVYTGMRKGEVCALRWSDVDLDRRMITVSRSYNGPPKSGKTREVPIPAKLAPILEAHKRAEPFAGELCFPNDDGAMYTKNGKLEDILRAALTSLNLRRVRVHDLRHVYAAFYLMSGGSLYDLSKNLGHHSVAFTAAIYGHLSADHRVKESDRLAFDAPPPAKVLPFVGPSSTAPEGTESRTSSTQIVRGRLRGLARRTGR